MAIANDQELTELSAALAEGREQVKRFAESLATKYGKNPEQVHQATRAVSSMLDDLEDDINDYLAASKHP